MRHINNHLGLGLPDLHALGLGRAMKEAARLVEEQDRLLKRMEELGYERMALEEEVRQGEFQHTEAWGRALRAGEEAPSEENLERAKKRLAAVRKEYVAVEHAARLADTELSSVITEHLAEYDAEVQRQAEKKLAEAERLAQALSEKLAEVDSLVGVHRWLNGPEGLRGYGAGPPATVSIDGLIHERRRDLGLLDVGVVR